MSKEFGVVYFVDGNPGFKRMMDISIESLRRFHPDWPVEILHSKKYGVPLWKKVYRAVSFWKWQSRRNRANWDLRVVLDKAYAMIDTPFEKTLYIDADTVVLRPMDELVERLDRVDVIATALGWKNYNGFQEWQPNVFPMIMAGVAFYNKRFTETYKEYVDRLYPYAGVNYGRGDDQYIFSMFCEMEKQNLNIELDQRLQLDAMNLAQHLGEDFPQVEEGILDLSWEALKEYFIFHYNGPYKPHYMPQIKQVFGLPSSG